MASSSENLGSLLFRPFQDSWISEICSRDTETLTKALQKSISNNNDSDSCNPFLNVVSSDTPPPTTPTASNVSGSDPETARTKRQRNGIRGATPKVSKRKSRASKRSQTTFITADPANFRQMVQQVTGVRFGTNAQFPVLKPEPQRYGSRFPAAAGGGCLPTLDTSAFLLDHQQQQVVGGLPDSGYGPIVGQGTVSFPQPIVADRGPGATGLDFESFCCFPTLESWKVM